MENQLLFCCFAVWTLDSIQGSTCTCLKDVCQTDSLRFSTVCHSNSNLLKAGSYQGSDNDDDDMFQIDDILVASSVKSKYLLAADNIIVFYDCHIFMLKMVKPKA